MTQTRAMSVVEVAVNVSIGWLVAFALQLLVFPAVGLQASLSQNFVVSLCRLADPRSCPAPHLRTHRGAVMPRSPITLTVDQVVEVETLAALLNQAQIADYFGISRRTFQEILRRRGGCIAV